MSGGTLAGVIGITILGASIVFVAPALRLVDNTHFDILRVTLFGIPAALIV